MLVHAQPPWTASSALGFPQHRGVLLLVPHCADRGWFFTASVLAFHKDQSLSQFCGQADSESKTLLLQASVCVCVWHNLEATPPP